MMGWTAHERMLAKWTCAERLALPVEAIENSKRGIHSMKPMHICLQRDKALSQLPRYP